MIWNPPSRTYVESDGRESVWTFQSSESLSESSYLTASFDFGFLNKVIVFLTWSSPPCSGLTALQLAERAKVHAWIKWRIEGYDLTVLKASLMEMTPLFQRTKEVFFERQPEEGRLSSGGLDFVVSYYEMVTSFHLKPILVHPSLQMGLYPRGKKEDKKEATLKEVSRLLEVMGEQERLLELQWHASRKKVKGVVMKAYDFSDALSLPFCHYAGKAKVSKRRRRRGGSSVLD